MADTGHWPPSLCDACLADVRHCHAERWRAVDRLDGTFGLRFTCPHIDVSLEACHDGNGRWHITDHGAAPGGVDVAHGRSGQAAALYHAADAFHGLGYFHPLAREMVADVMALTYAERFADAPTSARHR
jgi:hypothetical protein